MIQPRNQTTFARLSTALIIPMLAVSAVSAQTPPSAGSTHEVVLKVPGMT